MASIEALKNIASQLGNPQGEKGIEMGEMMNVSNLKMIRHSIDLLDIADGDSILEIGHGNCGHLAYLLSKANDLRYAGLEISGLMNSEAARINRELMETGRHCFILYDGHNIPYPDDTFDKAFTVNTLYFWEDAGRMLHELHRVMKPGGRLNVTFGQEHSMKQMPYTRFGYTLYDTEKLLDIARQTPFTVINIANGTEAIRNEVRYYMDRDFTTMSLQKPEL